MKENIPPNRSSEALDQLKQILLQQEKERLSTVEEELLELQARFNDKERLIESLDPVIADLLYKKIMESRAQMAEALAPVMGEALRTQINEAKDDIADALYPVIGKTVRKSVAEAMKNLMQAINERIDNLVSKGFGGRKKPDRITLLREVLPFHVQQVFLIHRETGLLLSHASNRIDPDAIPNEDMISGMLTAIREFSQTAFAAGDQSLHEIQYDNLNIIIEEGKYAYLAFVVSGTPGSRFKEVIKDLEHKIHLAYYKDLRAFSGETEPFTPIGKTLESFISAVHEPMFEEALAGQKKRGMAPLLVFAGLIVLLVAALFYFLSMDNAGREAELQSLLQQYRHKNGAFFSVERTDNRLILNGQAFAADRRALLQALEDAGFEVNSEAFTVLPPLSTMQTELNRLSRDLNIHPPLTLIADSAQFYLTGEVPDELTRIKAARRFAAQSALPLIWNGIRVTSPAREKLINSLNSQALYFVSGSARLNSESEKNLRQLLSMGNVRDIRRLVIRGCADATGNPQRNEELARQRARAVETVFLEMGMDRSRITLQTKIFTTEESSGVFPTKRRVDFKAE